MTRASERSVVIPLPQEPGAAGQALEGLYVQVPEPVGAAVIAPPHPLMGGSMESPVLTEVAWACGKADVSSLRFNWRGVGASAGEPSAEESVADGDFAAALDFQAETVAAPLVACGYSFGAAAALRAGLSRPDIQRLILVAPPTSLLPANALSEFRGQIFIAAGEHDEWVDVSVLSEQLAHAPAGRLEVIPDCDHFFMNGIGALGRAVAAWWGAEPA